MSQKPLSILISGAGVAGTTLALSLARHPSFQPRPVVTLIERSPVPRTTGQAIDIRGPGVRLLHKLGIEEKVKARHTTETGIAFIGGDGKDVAKFDKTENPEKQSATSEYEILRGELVGLLLEEVEEAKKTTATEVTTVYGEHIASLTEEEDGVTVTFNNGKLPSQKYDIVIAADGVNSRTRSMIFPNLKSEDCIEPWGLYMAYFSIPRIESDTSQWRWFHAPGGLGIHMRPHRNPSTVGVYLSMCMPKRERSPELDPILSQGAEAQKPILRERFKNIGWQEERILSEMERSSDFYMHHVCRVETPTWATRRCAIMGDAAHATMGIGTSNAMIGGYMIAGELAKVTTNSAEEIGAALKRYQDGLRPIAGGDNSKPPPGFPQMGNPQTWWGVGVMHTIIRMVAFTKLDRLFAGLGETDEGKWKLPEYGFP